MALDTQVDGVKYDDKSRGEMSTVVCVEKSSDPGPPTG